MDAARFLLRVCWPSPRLVAGVIGIVVTRAHSGCWAGPSLSLVAIVALSGVKVCSQVIGVEAARLCCH